MKVINIPPSCHNKAKFKNSN